MKCPKCFSPMIPVTPSMVQGQPGSFLPGIDYMICNGCGEFGSIPPRRKKSNLQRFREDRYVRNSRRMF